MAENVAGTIDARSLAIPNTEDTVILRPFEQAQLLAAPKRRCRQVFVDGGMEFDMVIHEKGFCCTEFPVDAAQGRTAVAGHVASGVQPRRHVPAPLHQAQAHQGLGAGQENPALIQPVFIVQRDLVQFASGNCHRVLPGAIHVRFGLLL